MTDGPDDPSPAARRLSAAELSEIEAMALRVMEADFDRNRALGAANAVAFNIGQVLLKDPTAYPRPVDVLSLAKRALKNLALNEARAEQRRQTSKRPIEDHANRIRSEAPDALSALLSAERKEQLHRTINRMPQRRREVTKLCLAGKLPPHIAAALSLSIRTVRGHLAKGFEDIRREMGDYMEVSA
jgi:DNA-directed RNA polymerase specialized sigma24 family protein